MVQARAGQAPVCGTAAGAASFPITNLGALKIVLGLKRFLLYIAFVMAFSLVTGLIVNVVL